MNEEHQLYLISSGWSRARITVPSWEMKGKAHWFGQDQRAWKEGWKGQESSARQLLVQYSFPRLREQEERGKEGEGKGEEKIGLELKKRLQYHDVKSQTVVR